MNEILDEIKNINYKEIDEKIKNFLVNEVENTKSNGVILGLSGGIDSTIIAYLCAKHVKDKTFALLMPDSDITPNDEFEDAKLVTNELSLEHKIININPIHQEFQKYIPEDDFSLGNLRARIRSNLIYYYGNLKKYLVLGSSDRSEYLIGYFTKFGDGSADILPIVSLYKTQLKEFGKYLGIPERIIKKKSSPNLWKGHFAEKEIGATYEEIDCILYCLFDKKMTIEQTNQKIGIDTKVIQKIIQMNHRSEHKRKIGRAHV